MNNSNITPKVYTLSAMILGYAMIGEYTANQQNAIGNWFMLIGQILETNSSIQQVFQNYNPNYAQNQNDNNGSNGINPNFPPPSSNEINEIREVLNNLLDKLDKMEKI